MSRDQKKTQHISRMTDSDRRFLYEQNIKAAKKARFDAREVIKNRDERISQIIKTK